MRVATALTHASVYSKATHCQQWQQ